MCSLSFCSAWRSVFWIASVAIRFHLIDLNIWVKFKFIAQVSNILFWGKENVSKHLSSELHLRLVGHFCVATVCAVSVSLWMRAQVSVRGKCFAVRIQSKRRVLGYSWKVPGFESTLHYPRFTQHDYIPFHSGMILVKILWIDFQLHMQSLNSAVGYPKVCSFLQELVALQCG